MLFGYNFRRYYIKRKHVKAYFSTIFTFLAFTLLYTGCNKKQKQNTSSQYTEENRTHTKNTHTLYPSKGEGFVLDDQKGEVHQIYIENNQLLFKDISQPVLLLHFFSPWSRPCQGEAPYLAQLQKKYADEVFVIGILVHPDKHLETLDNFIRKYDADYFITTGKENDRFIRQILSKLHLSNTIPIPLTIIYHGGHYYRHYEGAVPIEMIEHDIKTILK